MRRSYLLAATAVALGISAATRAGASLLGREMVPADWYHTVGQISDQIVWTADEFTIGFGIETIGLAVSGTGAGVGIQVDFDAASLSLVLVNPTGFGFTIAPFNGPVFATLLPHGITGATVNAATTMAGFDDSRVTLTDTEMRINWNGLGFQTGTEVLIDFAFGEPGTPPETAAAEPATLSLLGLGVLGLAAVRRRTV